MFCFCEWIWNVEIIFSNKTRAAVDIMEASTTKMKSYTRPQPLSELLAGLGLLSKNGMQTLTAKKQPRPTMAQTRTTAKVIRPLTLAEMREDILALKPMSPRRRAQPVSSVRKKGWNSSVKVDAKKISHTSDGHLKDNPVRKVLNFQSKPKPAPLPRMTMYNNTETPKFPKPEFRAKKSIHIVAKNSVRISGICNIPQTPVESTKPIRSRMTIANKENNPYKLNINKKLLAPPTPKSHKRLTPVLDTPMSNSSWKSGSDTSFLQREKEIHDLEEKVNAITEEPTLENIAEISPPVSTPFKNYRSVQEYFNNSSYVDNSAYNDNTIMCFDKPSMCKDADKQEESVIVSLCDLFNKATVTNFEKATTELDDLLEVEKQTENNIKMVESGIQMLNKIKESQMTSLLHVRKLIEEKKNGRKHSDSDKTLVEQTKDTNMNDMDKDKTLSPEKSPILSRPCSVIKKSPSYKIPRRSIGLRKKIIHKSMPNISSGMQTPVKDIDGKALNMYMKMKETMNFLSTPMVNRESRIPDTPAVTSHNLQKQLDKLYNRS